MEQRNRRGPPARAEDGHEGRRRDQRYRSARTRPARDVATGCPRQQLVAEHEPWRAVAQHEGAVGQGGRRRRVEAVPAGLRVDSLAVEPRVDRVGAGVSVEVPPD